MLQKLKSFLADDALYYSVVIILVAGASFGLGRQSVIDKSQESSLESQNSVVVTQPTSKVTTPTPNPLVPAAAIQGAAVVGTVSGEVVASKSGSKYHLPTCPGASQIKPANLISFPNVAAAEAAGYTPAANCKGLQ